MLRSPVLGYSFSLAVVLFGSLAACGTDNGEDPYTSPVPSSSASTTKDAGGTRPPFDAGSDDPNGDDDPNDKPDAGNPDPGDPDPGDPDPPDPGQCVDSNDPGGTEPLAKVLADTDDNQDHDITIKGVLNGIGDVDFYKFGVSDKALHVMNTNFATPTKGAELCVWISCKKGDIDFKGCKGGAEDNTLTGRKGCCVTGPGSPTPDWGCGSGTQQDDSANIVVRVRQSTDECLPYAWSYNF